MKILFLTTFLVFSSLCFAQRNGRYNNVLKDNKITITSITAIPNPFTLKTTIRFKSTTSQPVAFSVKNLLGKKIHSQHINAETGLNSIVFEKNNLIKGMYIYTLQSETEIISKRLVIQ